MPNQRITLDDLLDSPISEVSAERYHDISCGHRVVGHENKCRHLHGHNYRVTFKVVQARIDEVDHIGRVMDFSVIKEKLCMWLEDMWDHKFLMWEKDPLLAYLMPTNDMDTDINVPDELCEAADICAGSIVILPFNPTAENMAEYLVNVIGPQQLEGTGVVLQKCTVEETRKCSATFRRIA